MSFPVNISFKDKEFETLNKATGGGEESLREFVKKAALEKAAKMLEGGD